MQEGKNWWGIVTSEITENTEKEEKRGVVCAR
jgi:hypothetical protein